MAAQVLAGLGEIIHQRLEVALRVGCYCSNISKQHISNEHIVNLGLGSEVGEIDDHALQSWWAADLWQDPEKAFSADEVKRLGKVYKSNVQGHLLLSGFLLEVVEGEDYVYC